MKKDKNTSLLGFLVVLVMIFAACRKTEFMPEPQGSQVPYQSNATQTIEQLLAASPAKIFYRAWQKSTMKAKLEAKGKNSQFTVLVPSDAALTAAGFTNEAIAQMAVGNVDSLLMFYTSDKVLTKEQLGTYSIPLKTMLEQQGLRVNFYESDLNNGQTYDPYFHKLYLAKQGDDLLVNGKSVGKLNYQPALNGGIYLIEKAIERPTKTMEQVLKADGRFTFFLEVMQQSDEAYYDKIATDAEPFWGYKMSPEEVMMNFSYLIDRKRIGVDWGGLIPPIYDGYEGVNIEVTTIFAPTDEAFKNAGFQSVADVLAFNQAKGNVRFDDMEFEPKGAYPMDTLLNYHYGWGRILAPTNPSWGKAASNTTIFYSNDLSAEYLDDYILNIGGLAGTSAIYKMTLDFSAKGNTKQVRVKNSTSPMASVIDANINTLNGPIHVVDHLLVPPGFKLN